MYMPIPKGTVKKNPMQVRESQKYMFAALNLVLGVFGFAGYGLYTYIQKRSRGDASDNEARLLEDGSGNRIQGKGLAGLHRDAPKRVIIVGASAAGATTAAMITKADPSLEVLVFDENKRVPLTALSPYAQVGHRSYDLSTSGSPDTLSSPTTWTVTRDAKLIPKGVSKVKAATNTIVDSDGVEHRYDALVLAAGTTPDIDGCNIKGLKEGNVDKHRVCMSPHVTRDTLQTVWDGTVLCAKVSTRAFESIDSKKNSSSRRNLKVADLWASSHFSPLLIKGSRIAFDRSCDVSFISSINTIYKFLEYFKKLHRMPLQVYCDERSPCEGLGHIDYTSALLSFWAGRGVSFHGGQRLVEVDILNGVATFERTEAKVACHAAAVEAPSQVADSLSSSPTQAPLDEAIGHRSKVPFKLIFLDFPRKAPVFIAESGLSFAEADGYVAVDPTTLQHVAFHNIYAVGDCAALPTMKSYGAVFSQVPVVAHNVLQYLGHLKRLSPEALSALSAAKDKKLAAEIIPPPTAKYDGYSSAPVVMTTWRLMWPERRYKSSEVANFASNGYPSPQGKNGDAVASTEDERVNCHKWDNAAWRDMRGFLNGMYLQLFGYELMYWFVFMRGHWHPPTWFQPPHFPEGVEPIGQKA